MSKKTFESKQGFANIFLIVLVVALAGVVGYVTMVKKPGSEITPTPTSSPNPQDETANWKSFSGEGFEVLYPADIFAVVPIKKGVPPIYESNYSGNKLISLSQVSKLGKKECSNGQTVSFVICNAESGGGMEFILINASAQSLTKTLDSSIKSTVTIAGKEVVKYSIGAEGDGADYYYLPMSSNKTLVIARFYFADGFLQQPLFDQVLSTFKLLSVNISQLTKAQVLNGFDQCGNQFKNGEFNYPGGFEAWSKFELENNKLGKSSCAVYESLVGEKIVFFDLDGDSINEALVPARAVIASSGGELYVFKNVNGVARVVNAIGFGKENATVLSVNKDTIVVQTDGSMGYTPKKETYKFVNGELIKQ